MADNDICPKCGVGSIRRNTCWKCGYLQEKNTTITPDNHS